MQTWMIGLAAVLAALGLGYLALAPEPGAEGASVQAGGSVVVPAGKPVAGPVTQDNLPGNSPSRTAAMAVRAGASATPLAEPSILPRDLQDLTRLASGDQRLVFDEREKQVLGSKDVVDGAELTTIVLIRDVASGQVDPWRSGLRFALRSGGGYDEFFRDHPRLRRLFVNQEFAEAGVDVDDLAAQYRALSEDPRVAGVRLLPIVPKDKPG